MTSYPPPPPPPPPGGWGPPPNPLPAGSVPSYLAQSILCTLFCCLPFGIVSIVKASQVNSLWSSGRYEEAQRASADAKHWAWISFASGAVVIAIYLIAIISSGSNTTY